MSASQAIGHPWISGIENPTPITMGDLIKKVELIKRFEQVTKWPFETFKIFKALFFFRYLVKTSLERFQEMDELCNPNYVEPPRLMFFPEESTTFYKEPSIVPEEPPRLKLMIPRRPSKSNLFKSPSNTPQKISPPTKGVVNTPGRIPPLVIQPRKVSTHLNGYQLENGYSTPKNFHS